MRTAKYLVGSALAALLTASAGMAQTPPPATSCTAIPDAKIGYQLFNLSRVLRPAPPAAAAPAAPQQQADAGRGAAPAGGRGAGRGPQLPTPTALLDSNMAQMHAIGFKNVERFNNTLGESLSEYKGVMAKNGQNLIGNHGDLNLDAWDQAIADSTTLGQKYIGSAGFGQPGFKTLEDTLTTAKNLNELGKRATDRGLILYLHNHAPELNTKFAYDLNKDGKTEETSAWEIVAANTDPRYVHFEVDIHWARVGLGLDKFDELLAFLTKYQNRIVMLHVKDTTADGKITDLGQGTTNWPAVFRAAGPGIAYYIWEYDGVPDVFKSGDIAYRYLRCQK